MFAIFFCVAFFNILQLRWPVIFQYPEHMQTEVCELGFVLLAHTSDFSNESNDFHRFCINEL